MLVFMGMLVFVGMLVRMGTPVRMGMDEPRGYVSAVAMDVEAFLLLAVHRDGHVDAADAALGGGLHLHAHAGQAQGVHLPHEGVRIV